MGENVSQYILRRLREEWDVDRVYGYPGDGINGAGGLEWDSTTAVVVEAHADRATGLGYTYGPPAIAGIVAGKLAGVVQDADPLAPQAAWAAMSEAVRNSATAGLCAYAISAVDVALHDLKARLLGVSLADLLGRWHDGVEIYGSGGFTSDPLELLREQAAAWLDAAIGDGVKLMVDANGAFTPADAIDAAHGTYADNGVSWLEEPVTSDDHDGLRRVRDHVPPGMAIAAGSTAPPRTSSAGCSPLKRSTCSRST
jgi:L-alanine-DL-glutamate epimerase-like enolase superfamily enzyme